ncbi:hypothetical protein GY45DRAFT_458996 [Cubamyces sp. BRFM 1775]|nr:hypothetical protein GY45DRAFT_458996 [Cubamyces sp. BRFM 1775]
MSLWTDRTAYKRRGAGAAAPQHQHSSTLLPSHSPVPPPEVSNPLTVMSTRKTRSTAALPVAAPLHTVQCTDNVARGRYEDGTIVSYRSPKQIVTLGPPTAFNLRCLILENARYSEPTSNRGVLIPSDILACLRQLRYVQNVTIRNMMPVFNAVAHPEEPLHELPYIQKFEMEEHPHSMRYILSHLKISPFSHVSLTVGRIFPAERDDPANGLHDALPQNTECLLMLLYITRAELINRGTDEFAEIVGSILDKDGKPAGGRISLRIRKDGFPINPENPPEPQLTTARAWALYRAFALGPMSVATTSLNTLVIELNPMEMWNHWGIVFAQYPWLQHLIIRSLDCIAGDCPFTPWRILDALRARGKDGIVCPGLQTMVVDGWAHMTTLVLELEDCLSVRFARGAARLRELVVDLKPLPPGAVPERSIGMEWLEKQRDRAEDVRQLAQRVHKLSFTFDGHRYA